MEEKAASTVEENKDIYKVLQIALRESHTERHYSKHNYLYC